MNASAFAAPSDVKPTFRAGIEYNTKDTKLKLLTAVHNYETELIMTRKLWSHAVLGANLVFNPKNAN